MDGQRAGLPALAGLPFRGKGRRTVSVQDYQPWPGYRSAAKGVDAYRVTVTVEWPHGDNTRSVGLSTVRLSTEGGIGS
jgi:hypothetical protein